MAQENVDLVVRAYAAYADDGIEAVLPFFSDDVVLHSIPEWPDDPEYYGHEGARKLDRQWRDNFDGFGFRLQEVRDAGAMVLTNAAMTGRIKGTSDAINQPIGSVAWDIRGGRLGQIRYFLSWPLAVAAAGLPEEAAVRSTENLELARSVFGKLRIPGDPDGLIAAAAPSFELHLVGVGGEAVRYDGASGIREFFDDVEKNWESFRFEGTDLRDLGDRVLILGDAGGRGRMSGAAVDAQWACIVELEEGKATRVRGFLDHDEALRAAGLRA